MTDVEQKLEAATASADSLAQDRRHLADLVGQLEQELTLLRNEVTSDSHWRATATIDNCRLRAEAAAIRQLLVEFHPLTFGPSGMIDHSKPLPAWVRELAERVEHISQLHGEAVEGQLQLYVKSAMLLTAIDGGDPAAVTEAVGHLRELLAEGSQ